MSRRRFFFVSLALAVIAIGLQFTALGQFGHGPEAIAREIKRASVRGVSLSEQERTALKVEASRYSSRGIVIGCMGLAFALASIGFVVASARRHEPAWRSLTFALLFFYVMLQFMLV